MDEITDESHSNEYIHEAKEKMRKLHKLKLIRTTVGIITVSLHGHMCMYFLQSGYQSHCTTGFFFFLLT